MWTWVVHDASLVADDAAAVVVVVADGADDDFGDNDGC